MGFKDWLREFTVALKEHNLNPTEIDEIITAKYEDIREAFLNERDPEPSMYSIAVPFIKAKGVTGDKRIYDKYSAYDPKCFSISRCLKIYLNRMFIQSGFSDYLKSRPSVEYPGHNQIGGKFKIFEETPDCGSVIHQSDGHSKIVEILADHIKNSSDKTLVISILRSKYSIIKELISNKSGIPQALLNAGLPEENQQKWDDLTISMDTFINVPLFFMDLMEPVGIEEFIELIKQAQVKGDFKRIIITGLSYLEEFNTEKKDMFKETLKFLEEFSDQNGVELFAVP